MFTCHVGVLRIAARARAVAVRPGRGLEPRVFRCAARARAVAVGPLRGRGPRVMFRRAETPVGCLARRVISARGERARRPPGRGAVVSRASWFRPAGAHTGALRSVAGPQSARRTLEWPEMAALRFRCAPAVGLRAPIRRPRQRPLRRARGRVRSRRRPSARRAWRCLGARRACPRARPSALV